MTADPDPFEEGQRAARENIPAEANPYQDGSDEHALWSAGHEQVAGEAEANESEGSDPSFRARLFGANPESQHGKSIRVCARAHGMTASFSRSSSGRS